ncbi:hypothetical protein BT63DRAFT_411590 [Microthyrium microscopicum]|uniref:Ecp2 effector protein domain-containing protein n=1 Tax=Microthyrium microscopicum TaxID=703497 RepID=A0A6A6UKK5_9PEZI|nr:hypothetical protein BT63DRAFT_411590 [Microthyrium microscopicum]
MHLGNILSIAFGLVGVSVGIVLPTQPKSVSIADIAESSIIRRNTTSTADRYVVRCNENNLNNDGIVGCLRLLSDVNTRMRGQQCFATGSGKPGAGTFCQIEGAYVSGRGWSDNGGPGTTVALCNDVANAMTHIIDKCGNKGGSNGVFQTDHNDLVVHISDHWV